MVYCFFWCRLVLHEDEDMIDHGGGARDLIN